MLGLRRKRAMLSNESKTLSQLLREARESAATDGKEFNQQTEQLPSSSCNYALLFEQYGGNIYYTCRSHIIQYVTTLFVNVSLTVFKYLY